MRPLPTPRRWPNLSAGTAPGLLIEECGPGNWNPGPHTRITHHSHVEEGVTPSLRALPAHQLVTQSKCGQSWLGKCYTCLIHLWNIAKFQHHTASDTTSFKAPMRLCSLFLR